MKRTIAVSVVLLVIGIGSVGLVVAQPGGSTESETEYLTARVVRADVVEETVAPRPERGPVSSASDSVRARGTAI